MTLRQILTLDVSRVLRRRVKQVMLWDVGHAMTRPIRNPILKAACGWMVGAIVVAFVSMLVGRTPSDLIATVIMASFAVGAATSHLRWFPGSARRGGTQ